MKVLDDVSMKMLTDKYGNTPSRPSFDDLIKLQDKWRPRFREARHPYAFCGQKYV